jgi:hypothetical protein
MLETIISIGVLVLYNLQKKSLRAMNISANYKTQTSRVLRPMLVNDIYTA